MKKKYYLSSILFGLMMIGVSSCYVSKKYQRPSMAMPDLFRTDQLTDSASLVMDSVSMAEVSWQNFFSDELLKGYIQQGLDSNLDIRIALKNIDAAAAFVKQGKAAYEPTLTGSLTYSHIRNSKSSKIPQRDVDNFGLGVNASYEPDIWGKIRSQDKAFAATYLQTVEAHNAVKSRLIAAIATLYYQLMAVDNQIAIANQSILSRDSSLQTTKALMQSGQLTAVAVKQTEAQLYEAQLLLLSLQKQKRVFENAFCLLLNQPAHAVVRNRLVNQEVTTPLRLGIPSALLANRPDVRQAEFVLINAFELTHLAKSNFYPSFTITAGTGFQSADIEKWVGLNAIFANVAGGLVQPILNRRQIKTAYEVAKAKQAQALFNYQKILLVAGNDVSNALFDYQTETQSIDIIEKEYIALRTAVDYSHQLLLNGLANYLEVLTARQSALMAELNLVNARLGHLIAVVDLYQALGGGWR